MNESAVNQVIDKLAEKLGTTVEQMQPLAEEVVRQYVLCSWFYAVAFFLCLIGLLFMVRWAYSKIADAAEEFGYILIVVFGCIFGAISLIIFIMATGNALAPWPSLLGM